MDKDKERWSTRWKTKNWLRNSALSAIFSLTFVLQATHVRAGKKKVEEYRHEPSSDASLQHKPVYIIGYLKCVVSFTVRVL